MSAVAIHNLHVKMGPVSILEQLDLSVHEGEFLVLLGPSGCGKSTLLHSVAGLLDVEAGSISIGGRDVFREVASRLGLLREPAAAAAY